MTYRNLLTATALQTGALIAFASATPSFGQGTRPVANQATPVTMITHADVNQVAPKTDTSIVVTGSRIRRPNIDSPVPVTSVNQEQLFESGKVAIGETLNQLPQLRVSVGQQNGINNGLGNAGLSLLDLRGLGTQRTLVLVNGRRQVGSDIFGNASSPDVNTIPTALIDRVDVVTGGDSAIYGSDAIAGVVNFILKRNFDGIDVRGQTGISQYSDANSYFASVTVGRNFAGGRGNVVLSGEWAKQDQYFGNKRPSLAQQRGFLVVDTDIRCTSVSPLTPSNCDPNVNSSNSDGVPDRAYFQDIRSAVTSNTGLVVFYLGRQNATFNCGTDPLGGFYNCPYIFQPDGTLVPETGRRVAVGPNGSFIGGNGNSFREGDQLQLSAGLTRYVINGIAHFDVSPAFSPFVEAKYARTQIIGAGNSGPAFIISNGNAGDLRQTPRLDNPFLSTQARNLLTSTMLTSGFGTGTIGSAGQTLTAADRANIANGSFRFRLAENFINFPKREQDTNRDTYQFAAGVRGTFNTDWNYEVSANYGEFHEHQLLKGNYNRQRFLLAMDATRNSSGQIVCRSQIDPTAAIGLSTAGGGLTAAERATILAADVAACVPLNPFGGAYTPEMVNYIVLPTRSQGKITQFVANGFMAGDTSGFFNLPGGPVGFAIGAEYRRETNAFAADQNVREGYTFFNPVADIVAPSFEVKEAFAEVRLPIVKDIPLFKNLEINGALRYANYKGRTGSVLAYNAGAQWSPFIDLKLRANYSRAVRAPLLSELYAKQVGSFAGIGGNDPCSLRNRSSGSSTRAANCAALGVPAAYDFIYPGSLTVRTGGNPNLKQESSDSYTFGGVLQPRLVPGLSISADYYNIKVRDVITGVGALTILQQCVDLPTINNPFCGLFQRNPGPGVGPAGEEPGRVLEGSLLISTLNYAFLRERGIDAEIAYRRRLGDIGMLDMTLNWTHLLQRSAFTNPSNPKFEDVIMGELGDPKDKGRFRANLKHGPLDLTYTMEYIGRMYLNTYEDYNSVNGQPPQNADYATIKFYPNVFYHNVRVGMDIMKRYKAYVGVDNIMGKLPPYGLTGIGFGSGIYDNRGRFYYAGVRANF